MQLGLPVDPIPTHPIKAAYIVGEWKTIVLVEAPEGRVEARVKPKMLREGIYKKSEMARA